MTRSRISGACNGCRTKKQKCSGDRSGCTQCAATGITCTWPEQRKRGPAKGYIEGLESRLHEAETLLLHLLPLISSEQLSTAIADPSSHNSSHQQNQQDRESPDIHNRSSPPMLNKKTGIDYWETFPLDSVENVRRWQQDCEEHSQNRASEVAEESNLSRPNSVEINRDRNSSITSNSINQPQLFSTARNYLADHSQTEISGSQTSVAPQNWHPTLFKSGSNKGNLVQNTTDPALSSGYSTQPWQTTQTLSNSLPQQKATIPNVASMEVDNGGLFSEDAQRRLFW